MTEISQWINAAASLIFAATNAPAESPPVPKSWPCHFAGESVTACRGMDHAALAAQLWRKFGLDSARMNQPGIKAWIAGQGCVVVHSTRGALWEIYRHGAGQVPTSHGYEPVQLILLARIGTPLVISAHYVVGTCPADDGQTTYEYYHPSGT